MWLVSSLKFIDYTKKEFLSDCIAIGFLTKGGFSYKDLCELTFDEFELVLNESINFVKEINNG